jgi:hypothetical protein
MKMTTRFVMMSVSVMISGLAAGCSDEADIGIDTQPVTCDPDAAAVADVSGAVTDPSTGTTYDMTDAQPAATRSANGGGETATLNGGSLVLRFGFYCGPSSIDRFGVRGDTQEGLDCPLEVASVVLGRIEYLPAESGTLLVDETQNCLAGRYRVDFGDNGVLTGTFSAPWTVQ